jgi:hypothetical protein
MQYQFADQASKCREQARQYAGRPEQTFLLRVANAFEDLALSPRDRGHHGQNASAGQPRPAKYPS